LFSPCFKTTYTNGDGRQPVYEVTNHVFANDATGANLVPFDKTDNYSIKCTGPLDLILTNFGRIDTNATRRDVAFVKFILSKGACSNPQTSKGHTPLMICAASGRVDIATVLLNQNADPNTVDSDGCTSLMWAAAKYGRGEMVQLLLSFGADVNAQMIAPIADSCSCYAFAGFSDGCHTPLTALALAAERGDIEVVKLLLDHKADPNMRIVHHAHGNVENAGRPKGSHEWDHISASESDSDTPANREERKGFITTATALTWARGDIRELLLERGADPGLEVPTRECGCDLSSECDAQESSSTIHTDASIDPSGKAKP
jgi:hypothetical protein